MLLSLGYLVWSVHSKHAASERVAEKLRRQEGATD